MRASHDLRDDRFDATESITICAVTSDPAEAPLFRVPIAPTNDRAEINSDIASGISMERVNQAILIFLGLGG